MKKVFIAFIALATLASCSKVEIETPPAPATPDATAPITLSAGIEVNTVTKAAIESTTFPINTDNVFRLTAYAGTAVPTNWAAPYFNDQQVNSGTASALTFASAQYYPADGGQKLYFYAYAPEATTLTPGTAVAAPIANYTITGQEDIMAAQVITGINKVASGVTQPQPELNFKHKLKQIKFVVKMDDSFEAGVNVTSISVTSVKNSAKLNVKTGDLTFDGTATHALSAYLNTTGIEITKTGATIPGSIMFEPGTTFTLDVIAGGVTYKSIKVTLSGANAGGASVSHKVTLTFKRSGVTPTATIGAWTAGSDNSTDIQ